MDKQVGLLVGLLVLALGSGVVAEDSSQPPWFGGQVEIPGLGYAVSVPDGWVAVDPSGDVEMQWRVIGETWDGWFRDTTNTDVFGDIFLMAGPGTGSFAEECDVRREPAGTGAALEAAAEQELRRAADGEGVERDIRDIRGLDLPAGRATIVDYVQFDRLHFAIYAVERDDEAVMLTCMTWPERPADNWLSIAETLEFLPEDT